VTWQMRFRDLGRPWARVTFNRKDIVGGLISGLVRGWTRAQAALVVARASGLPAGSGGVKANFARVRHLCEAVTFFVIIFFKKFKFL